MHELAIAQSLADAVRDRALECGARRVTAIRLRVGEASGVVVSSLSACFELLAEGDPLLAGARLAVEAVPHRARCATCEQVFAVVGYVARCPTCGAWSAEVVSGTELDILDMEIVTGSEAERTL